MLKRRCSSTVRQSGGSGGPHTPVIHDASKRFLFAEPAIADASFLAGSTVADKRTQQNRSSANLNYLRETECRIRLSKAKGVEKAPSEVFPTVF